MTGLRLDRRPRDDTVVRRELVVRIELVDPVVLVDRFEFVDVMSWLFEFVVWLFEFVFWLVVCAQAPETITTLITKVKIVFFIFPPKSNLVADTGGRITGSYLREVYIAEHKRVILTKDGAANLLDRFRPRSYPSGSKTL